MITLEELNQVYYADKNIQLTAEKIKKLEAKATQITQIYAKTPLSHSSSQDKLGEIIAAIADEKEKLRKQMEQETVEVLKLNSFISQIPDCQIKLIFSARFIMCLTWEEVADKVGGNNTADSVKKMCYRYIRKYNLQSAEKIKKLEAGKKKASGQIGHL